MADIRITDLVDEKVFSDLEKLSADIKALKEQYVSAAQALANGLNMKVSIQGDLDKFNKIITENAQKAQQATEQLNGTITKQREIIGQTTNVISRELAEIEKENKAKREAFEQDKSAVGLAESLLGTRAQNIQRLADLQEKLKEVKNTQKDLDDQEKSGAVSAERAMAVRTNLIAKQREYQAAIKDLNLVLNNQEKQMQASEGSYQKLSLQLEMLKRAYKGLTEEEKNNEIGKTLGEEIGNLDAHLKDLAADMGEFQRNTGNYAIANQTVKGELRELVQEIALLTLQYRSMSEEEQKSAAGQELETKMNTLKARASELKDAVADVNREILSGANDTKNFSAITEGINMLISGVGGLTAASHALGIGEKDLVKIQTTLQASLAASNALTKAQAALQKESNLMAGVARVREEAHAAAIKIRTAAEGKGVIATAAATAAQRAFNVVARANPYVLLATGIGLLVAAIYGFTKATKSETEEQKKAREEMEKSKKEYEEMMDVEKKLKEARESGIDSCSKEIAELQTLYNVAIDTARALNERKLAVDKLQELYPQYFGNIKDEIIMAGQAEEAYDKLTNAIIDKAIAEAKQDLIKKYAAEYVKSIEKMQEARKQIRKMELGNDVSKILEDEEKERAEHGRRVVDIEEDKLNKVNNVHKKRDEEAANMRKAQLQKELQDAKRQAEEYEKAMKEIQKSINVESLLKDVGGKVTTPKTTTTKATKSEKEETAKTYEEIKEVILENTQEIIAERLKMTEKGSKEEYDLTLKYIEAEQMLREIEINKSYTKQREELDKSLKLQKITQEEYNESIKQLEETRANQVDIMVKKEGKARIKAQKDYMEAYITSMQKIYAEEQEMRSLNLTRDLTALAKQRAEKIITEEEYQKQLAELQQKYAEETANKQIEMLEKVLEAEELTAEQRAKITKELAKLKADSAKRAADAELASTKKQEKEDEKAAKQREKNVKNYLKAVSDMVGKVNKLVSTIYDGQIKDIEDQQDAADEAHDRDIERIEQLEETGAISKEEAEARKRAADQRTADKQEELEKKKQELRYKQAVWEKVTSIAQAGIATALAITEALPNFVLAALVGAMGAIEVATIIATPIASYAKGTKDKEGHPGGLAVVGDAGKKEAVVYDNKMWITPDKPTLVDMPKGAIVYPDADKIPEPVFMNVVPGTDKDSSPIVIVSHDSKKLERSVAQTNQLLKKSIIMQKRLAYDAAYANYKNTRL